MTINEGLQYLTTNKGLLSRTRIVGLFLGRQMGSFDWDKNGGLVLGRQIWVSSWDKMEASA